MLSYIDANFIVKAYTDNPDREICRERLDRGGLATSPVAVIEAWQMLLHILKHELANKVIIDLLRRDVDVIGVGPSLIHEAVRKQPAYSLDAFDTFHVVSAQLSGCYEILTFDNDLLRIRTEPQAKKPSKPA